MEVIRHGEVVNDGPPHAPGLQPPAALRRATAPAGPLVLVMGSLEPRQRHAAYQLQPLCDSSRFLLCAARYASLFYLKSSGSQTGPVSGHTERRHAIAGSPDEWMARGTVTKTNVTAPSRRREAALNYRGGRSCGTVGIPCRLSPSCQASACHRAPLLPGVLSSLQKAAAAALLR
ncbi:unnamed protein product [Gadus morhua 'NCC']